MNDILLATEEICIKNEAYTAPLIIIMEVQIGTQSQLGIGGDGHVTNENLS